MNVRARIEAYNRGREPERLAIKYQRMSRDALAFYRGTPHLFYEDWPAESPLNDAPAVWLCGDLHLENFGTYRGDNRSTYFDFNDFDEACLGPATWDLTRLMASVAIEAAEREWKHKEAEELCARVIDSYATALETGKARWVERETAEGIVQDLFQTLQARTWPLFLGSRTQLDGRRRLLRKDGVKALPLAAKRDASKLEEFVDSLGRFRYLDAARRIAGNSSLGVPRFVLLVEDKEENVFLLDLKLARPPVGLAFPPEHPQPDWESEAHRVAGVQTMVQAIPPAFLRPAKFDRQWWILRELMPSEDRVDVAEASHRRFAEHAAGLGQVVAWGHLRSGGRRGSSTIDALIEWGGERKWRAEVARYGAAYARRVRADWESFRRGYRREKA